MDFGRLASFLLPIKKALILSIHERSNNRVLMTGLTSYFAIISIKNVIFHRP